MAPACSQGPPQALPHVFRDGSPSEDAKGRFRFDVVCGKDELRSCSFRCGAQRMDGRHPSCNCRPSAGVGRRRVVEQRGVDGRAGSRSRRQEDTTTISAPPPRVAEAVAGWLRGGNGHTNGEHHPFQLVTAASESEETISEEPLIEPAGEPSPEQAQQQQHAPVRDLTTCARESLRVEMPTARIAGLQSWRAARRFCGTPMSNVSEFRVDEAVELQIGRFAVRGLTVTLHKNHTLSLARPAGAASAALSSTSRDGSSAPPWGAPQGAAMELGLAATVPRQWEEAAADPVKRQARRLSPALS